VTTAGGEFDLIERHLANRGAVREDVVLGVGDDAALVALGGGHTLTVACVSAACTADPARAASECVAMAAGALRETGATPAWATTALTLRSGDEAWVAAFASALDAACRELDVAVVGGDTTAGDTAVSLYLIGHNSAGP
jgi:thiamine-monophosphate kinase